MSLIGVDLGNTSTRMSRFANYLRNLIPSNDVTVMEMAAKAVGILAVSSGAFAAEYVEFEMKRVLEWLTGDRNEGRRHAAVSIARPPDLRVEHGGSAECKTGNQKGLLIQDSAVTVLCP